MKSVLISIQPKWCELIANGKKTIEVRKTRPKIETPFKVYIYETKALYKPNGCNHLYEGKGKVIGEFVCDEIYTINKDSCGWFYRNSNEVMGIMYAEEVEELYHCIPDDELKKYLGNYIGYGWHISNLVIYDEPRELSKFKTLCTDFYDGKHCDECEYFIDGRGYEYDESDCGCDGLKPLKRPPQSWCYVESEVEGK